MNPFDLSKLKPYLLLIPAVFLQITLLKYIAIEGVVPYLPLVILVFFTLRWGRIWGMINSAVFALIYDITTGNPLGSTMFALTIAIFVAGFFFNEQKTELYMQTFYFGLIVFLAAMVHCILFSLITGFDPVLGWMNLFFFQGFLPAVYTTFIALFISAFYPRRGLE